MNPQDQTGYSQPAGQQTQSTTDQMAQQVKDKTGDMVQQAQDTARSTIHQQKGRAAGSLGAVADALHQTSQNLQNQDQGPAGQVIDQIASRLDGIANDLQTKTVDEILDDVQDFARRDPQLFLGGAVVLGLLAARFLKASSDRQQARNYGGQRPYPGSYYGSQPSRGYSQRDLADYRNQTMRDEYTGSPTTQTNSDYSSGTSGYSGARVYPDYETSSGMSGSAFGTDPDEEMDDFDQNAGGPPFSGQSRRFEE